MIQSAKNLAIKAHSGQRRRSGQWYVMHPFRVACIVRKNGGDEDVCVGALLHDVLEDSSVRVHHLKRIFSARVVAMVDAVSRRSGESEREYFSRIWANPDAIKIKMADIEDNLPTAKEEALERYFRFLEKVKKEKPFLFPFFIPKK